jgi:beta-glucanase (GH16 family)
MNTLRYCLVGTWLLLVATACTEKKAITVATPTPPMVIDNGPESTPTSNTTAWQLTFEETFTNPLADSRWRHEWPCQNNNPTCYFNGRFEAVYLKENYGQKDGLLWLDTKRQTYLNWDKKEYNYSSAVLTTSGGRFEQQYGYFEVRMKPASTPGNDPAFWLAYMGGWPPEIDIAEFAGAFGGRLCGQVLHAGPNDSAKSDGSVRSTDLGIANFNDDFHTYGLLWENGKLVWYVDGKETRRISNNPNVPSVPLFVLLSDEIRTDAGAWFGNPATGTYPARTLIDYVRVWKKKP